MNADASPASGHQHEIRGGGYTAVVTEVGASLRLLRHGDRDLVVPWDADQVRPRFRGAVLAPWPNRVRDGRYSFDGAEYQLDVSEVPRHTAIHGLVSWRGWAPVETAEDAVELGTRLWPSAGYPFLLDLRIRYAVGTDGLRTTLTARNAGSVPAPYGCAPHPYLVAGPGRVDDWALDLPAQEVLQVDPERLLPDDPPVTRPVAGTGLDLHGPRPLAGVELDHAFTGLGGGPVAARLTTADGDGVEIAWDAGALPWVQVHTADRPEPEDNRVGLAVEPMTCPPDAFRSGRDLVVLPAGGEHTASWTVRALR